MHVAGCVVWDARKDWRLGVDRDQNNGNERISSSDEEKRPCSQRK